MRVSTEALRELVVGCGLVRGQNSVSWIFDCPLCSKKQKLYMRKADGRFVCWVCKEEGFQGRPEYALTELLGLPLSELRSVLYGGLPLMVGGKLEVQLRDFYGDSDPVPESTPELPEIDWDPTFVTPHDRLWQKAQAYLDTRGISQQTAIEVGMRYSPSQQRVAIPVIVGGKLLGWQGRSIANATPKILTSKGLGGGRVLMFQDSLVGSAHAIIAEGPFDALKARSCGGAVATMGKAVSRAQLAIIARSGVKKVVVALDPDAAKDSMRIVRELYEVPTYIMRPPPHRGDLGECTEEEVQRQFATAERWTPSKILVYLDRQAAVARHA